MRHRSVAFGIGTAGVLVALVASYAWSADECHSSSPPISCGVNRVASLDPLVAGLTPERQELAHQCFRFLVERDRQVLQEKMREERERLQNSMKEDLERLQGIQHGTPSVAAADASTGSPPPPVPPVRSSPCAAVAGPAAETSPMDQPAPRPQVEREPPQVLPPAPEMDGPTVEPFYEEPLESFWGDTPTPPAPAPAAPTSLPDPERSRLIRAGVQSLGQAVLEAQNQYGVRAGFILCVMDVESDFDPEAISYMRAQGLMQLVPETAADLRVGNPYDIRESVLGGTRYIAQLLQEFDSDPVKTMAAYNAGPARVKQLVAAGRFPGGLPEETRHYLSKIFPGCGPAVP